MRLICFILLFILYDISCNDESEKYRALREQCERTPSNSQCVALKTSFLDLIKKCLIINTQQKAVICQQVKTKLCAIFPTTCGQTTTKKKTTRRATTKSKLIKTTTKAKLITTTTTPTTTKATAITATNEEFAEVPVNPDELRIRGEYCVRHGKEKKCQQLLNNLKTTYSSCKKKKPEVQVTKPADLDCHSFESHMCIAFPKFPPCIKKTPKVT